MKSLLRFLPFVALAVASCSAADNDRRSASSAAAYEAFLETESARGSDYRGWDYLVRRLRAAGVPEAGIKAVYQDPRLPLFDEVPFRIRPLETHDMYAGFRVSKKIDEGLAFLEAHREVCDRMEFDLSISRYVVAAIHLVETHFGKNTGKELIVYRLSRVASVGEPRNLRANFERLKRDDPSVTFEQVVNRARFLEETFTPELHALISLEQAGLLKVFDLKGSIAGAFGLPQFLPSSYMRYGMDGDRDGVISLFNVVDAIFSAGNYLKQHGWRDDLSSREKRRVIWHYNHSEPYVDTVLWLADAMAARAKLRRMENLSTAGTRATVQKISMRR